jgi:hypothetical protein
VLTISILFTALEDATPVIYASHLASKVGAAKFKKMFISAFGCFLRLLNIILFAVE